MITDITQSDGSIVRAFTRAAVNASDRTVQPPMTEETAARLSNLTTRFIPFIPTDRDPVDEYPCHRCQLGTVEGKQIEVWDSVEQRKVVLSVTYFHLKAWGRTWSEAVEFWKKGKK